MAAVAEVTERAGGVNVTVTGTEAVAEKAAPVMEATFALRLSVDDPAARLELPVSVKVHDTVPDAFRTGALHEAESPLGKPEATLILDPAALPAAVKPPTGVAVTVTWAVDNDCMEMDAGEAARMMPGACVTWSVICLVATRPSPAAVIVIVEVAIFAEEAAVNVNVSMVELVADGGVMGFADQAAVTPLGSPAMLQVTLPVKDPPVTAARLNFSVPD
jgi:hypothetical protein